MDIGGSPHECRDLDGAAADGRQLPGRQAFRAMETRIKVFLSLPVTRLEQSRLNERMDAIGRTPDRGINAQ